jgi:hypothetical protein
MTSSHQLPTPRDDWTEHERTYRWFVTGVFLFAAHALVILLVLAWVFADSLGSPPVAG